MKASDVSTRRDSFSVPKVFLLLAGATIAPIHAQIIPAGATPGGVLPRISQATQPEEAAADLIWIPRVSERPLGIDEGPRIIVQKFLHAGVVDRADRGVSVRDVEALLEAARQAQPPEGYTINQLQEVAGKVAEHYREQGFILAQSFVPQQEVRGGEVMVHVLEGKLGQVTVEGNKSYSSASLLRPFNALVGGPVDRSSIESALLTLTDYPGVTAFGVLGAGPDVGTTNLTVRIQGEDRVQIDTSVDNHGSQFAGEYRGQAAFNFNNVVGRADRLRFYGLYGFDSSDSAAEGLYGGVDYEIPLFSPRDSVTVSFATNTYDVGNVSPEIAALENKGESSIAELAYRHDLRPSRLGSASVGVALSVKEATFEQLGLDRFRDELTTARLDLGWDRIDTRFRGVNQVKFSYTHGFKDYLGSLDDYDPTSRTPPSRFGASGEFDKVSFLLQRLQRITQNTSFLLRVEGQHTNDPLVSLEQFSLAGPDAVRAYPVAEVLAERGAVASAELIFGAPGFASKPAFAGRTWGQVLQFSLFADYAHGEFSSPVLGGTDKDIDLAGWGGALQFSLPRRVFARLDVATPITDRAASNDRDPQYYFRFGFAF